MMAFRRTRVENAVQQNAVHIDACANRAILGYRLGFAGGSFDVA